MVWLRLTTPALVVSTENEMIGVDPVTGAVRWRRPDYTNIGQLAFENAIQSAPVPGAARATESAPTIRTMEEIPGTAFAAILSDSGGQRSWFDVIDLTTGQTVWSSTALPLTEARGFLPFPDGTTLLVHGMLFEPGRTRSRCLRVNSRDGRVIWAQDELMARSPAQFEPTMMLASRGTINGNQPPVPLPDSTVIVFVSEEGPMRLDMTTGAVVWRTAGRSWTVSPTGQGYAAMLPLGDTLLIADGKAVEAIAQGDGHLLWSSGDLPGQITQFRQTEAGLVVRGAVVLDPLGQPVMQGRPFLGLLDPATGKSRWPKLNKQERWSTPFVVYGKQVFVAAKDGVFRIPLESGIGRPITTSKYSEAPLNLELHDQHLLATFAHGLAAMDTTGSLAYVSEFKAPSPGAKAPPQGVLGRLWRFMLSGAVGLVGDYYSSGWLAGSAFAHYHAEVDDAEDAYFLVKDIDDRGPGVVRVDKRTGRVLASVPANGDKSPAFMASRKSGLLLLLTDGRNLGAYAW